LADEAAGLRNARHGGCTELHCTPLQCTAPHCTALHRTALHRTALHRKTVGGNGRVHFPVLLLSGILPDNIEALLFRVISRQYRDRPPVLSVVLQDRRLLLGRKLGQVDILTVAWGEIIRLWGWIML
jgi:hypothetical protein